MNHASDCEWCDGSGFMIFIDYNDEDGAHYDEDNCSCTYRNPCEACVKFNEELEL